jgi:predicted esterase
MLGERYGCIVACPELIGTDGLLGDGPIVGMLSNERYILSLVRLLTCRYNIDRANVMITGFSGGGFPTYWVGLRHPDVFSVVAARSSNFNRPNLDGWYSPEAKRTPILIYHGENDPGAIVRQSRDAVEYLRSRGFANVQARVIPGGGHERHPEVAMDFFRRNFRTPRPSM